MPLGRQPTYNRPFARMPLEDALNALEDADVEAGQALRDRADWKVEDRGKGLWVGSAQGVEVELQLAGRKVRDYVCECSAFRQNQRCHHFAALLAVVHLRKQPQRKAAGPPRRRQAISTRGLVNRLSDHDLRSFVADYATRHPEFALDLKVRFAHDLPVNDRFERVITRLLRRNTPDYGPKQAKRITESLRVFAQQREGWLAEKAYLDVFELNTALVPKLVVIVGKAARIKVDLPEYLRACITELVAVVESGPAPVILERIEAWTRAQLEVGAYYRNGLDVALLDLLAATGTSAEEVRAQLADANERYGVRAHRVAAIIDSYYAEGNEREAERLLLEHLGELSVVRAALAREVERGNYRRAVRLARAALAEEHEPADRLQIVGFVVAAAQAAGDADTLVRYAPELILASGELDAARESLDALDDGALASVYEAVLRKLASSPLRPEVRERLGAEVLLRLGRLDELEQLLYRTQREALVATMLPELVGKLADEDLRLLLQTKVREHLDNRFGKQPAEYVTRLIDEVARRSRTDLTSSLVMGLRKDYRQRTALLDALDSALL